MKKLLTIIVLAAAVVGLTFAVKPKNTVAPIGTDQTRQQSASIVSKDYVKYPGQDGKNAFELLQAVTKVESKKYDFGMFVQSIGGVKPDDKHFWKLYVNGQESQVGADKLQTHSSDVLEWKLSEINK